MRTLPGGEACLERIDRLTSRVSHQQQPISFRSLSASAIFAANVRLCCSTLPQSLMDARRAMLLSCETISDSVLLRGPHNSSLVAVLFTAVSSRLPSFPIEYHDEVPNPNMAISIAAKQKTSFLPIVICECIVWASFDVWNYCSMDFSPSSS